MSNRSVFNIQRVYVIKHQWNIFHLTESQPRNHLNINTSESPIMNTLFSIKLLIGWPSRISCLKEQIREPVTEENASVSLLNYSSFPCVFRTLGWKRLCVCVCFVKQWLMLTTRGKNNEARLAGNTVREKQIWGGSAGDSMYTGVCVRACVHVSSYLHLLKHNYIFHGMTELWCSFYTGQPYFPVAVPAILGPTVTWTHS